MQVSPRAPLHRTEEAYGGGERGLRPRSQIEKRPDRTKPEQSPTLANPILGPNDGVHLSLPRARPKYWSNTRARLDVVELAAEVGPLSVPPPQDKATSDHST
jgi:hypothetical protein